MKNSGPKRMTLAELESMAQRDKRRMITMGIGAAILLGGVIWTTILQKQYEDEEQSQHKTVVEAPVPQSELYLPPFQEEDRAVLKEIRDSTKEERLQVHSDARLTLLTYALFLTPRHFDALGVRILDADGVAILEADAAAHRMAAFTTRGTVTSLGTFQSPDSSIPEYRGQIESEYGGSVQFALAIDPSESGFGVGSFVRIDGLFLQWTRQETSDGWEDTPLLCGRKMTASMERIHHSEEDLLDLLAEVTDGDFDSGAEIAGQAKWALLAKGRDAADSIDWDAAPELNSDTITSIFKNPKLYRGRAFRLPVSVNMGLDDPVYGENPLRADAVSTGWVGNQLWIGPAPVIKWVAAMDASHLMNREGDARYLYGRGFFLKNLNYENPDGRPLRAPVFAMASMEVFTPIRDTRTHGILWAMAAVTGLLLILFVGLLMRDKRDSRRLQEEMVRRRRSRRSHPQTTTDSPS